MIALYGDHNTPPPTQHPTCSPSPRCVSVVVDATATSALVTVLRDVIVSRVGACTAAAATRHLVKGGGGSGYIDSTQGESGNVVTVVVVTI